MDSLTGMDSAAGRSGVDRESIGGRSGVDWRSMGIDRGRLGLDRRPIGGRSGADRGPNVRRSDGATAAAGTAYAIHREPPV